MRTSLVGLGTEESLIPSIYSLVETLIEYSVAPGTDPRLKVQFTSIQFDLISIVPLTMAIVAKLLHCIYRVQVEAC